MAPKMTPMKLPRRIDFRELLKSWKVACMPLKAPAAAVPSFLMVNWLMI
jgi:hypothetical protein